MGSLDGTSVHRLSYNCRGGGGAGRAVAGDGLASDRERRHRRHRRIGGARTGFRGTREYNWGARAVVGNTSNPRSISLSTRACLLVLCLAGMFVSAAGQGDGTLYVHVIPHSHCDPGWLDTFEQYYQRDVSHILTGVMRALEQDSSRRFVWAEISFFMRWYKTLTHEDRLKFKGLVDNGQLEFVGGGWVQNDEANPNMEAVINQVTEGHDYLLKLFGVRPKIGWQIDPFGHSALTPSLWSLLGYDAAVINRIHYETKRQYKQSQGMEFVWNGARLSTLDDRDTTMFTHVLHSHYSAPRGFDWENPGVMGISPMNARSRAASFVGKMKQRARAYRTRHLLVPFGDDFKFKNAMMQFRNMDMIIKSINSQPGLGVSVHYSTLSEYFSAVHTDSMARKIKFPLYQGDFFPYADNGDSYWTGYYTTRPNLKAMCRLADASLRAVEALFVFARISRPDQAPLKWNAAFRQIEALRLEAALVLHHDAITGTSRTTVVADYKQRLVESSNEVHGLAATLAGWLLTKESAPSNDLGLTSTAYTVQLAQSDDASTGFPVIVQNPLGWERHDVVSVALADSVSEHVAQNLQVVDSTGNFVAAQVHATLDPTDVHTPRPSRQLRLYFRVRVPPLGLSTYFVRHAPRADRVSQTGLAEFVTAQLVSVSRSSGHVDALSAGPTGLRGGASAEPDHDDGGGDDNNGRSVVRLSAWPGDMQSGLEIKNEQLTVQFLPWSGNIASVTTHGGKPRKIKQEWKRYSSTRSGAYLFRPHSVAVSHDGESDKVNVAIIKGKLVQEVQYFASQVQQTTRLLNVPGPVGTVVHLDSSSTADMNKEVVLRLSTDIVTGGTFLTDNSADMVVRHPNSGAPVASRYYPMNTAAALRDQSGDMQLTLLNRQPMGCASLNQDNSGSDMEVMIQRNLRSDDGRGLAQGVHDSSRGRVDLWLLLDDVAASEASYRTLSYLLHHPLVVMQSRGRSSVNLDDWKTKFKSTWSPMGRLPADLGILSIKARDSTSDDVLLRLHNFGAQAKVVPASVRSPSDAGLLAGFRIKQLQKRTLSLNQDDGIAAQSQMHFPYVTDGSISHAKTVSSGGGDEDDQQNTEEEGVFISDAALAKLAEDRKVGGQHRRRRRRRLQQRQGVSASSTQHIRVPPYQLVSYLTSFELDVDAGRVDLPAVTELEAPKDLPGVAARAQVHAGNRPAGTVAVATTAKPAKPTQQAAADPAMNAAEDANTAAGAASVAGPTIISTHATHAQLPSGGIPIVRSRVDGANVPQHVVNGGYRFSQDRRVFAAGLVFGISIAVVCGLCVLLCSRLRGNSGAADRSAGERWRYKNKAASHTV